MTENTFECVVCYSINSASNLHCSICGSIPAHYSIIGHTATFDDSRDNPFLPIDPAHGCFRQFQSYSYKSKLYTVPLDYYGDSDND